MKPSSVLMGEENRAQGGKKLCSVRKTVQFTERGMPICSRRK
jgi:hypothetical protein